MFVYSVTWTRKARKPTISVIISGRRNYGIGKYPTTHLKDLAEQYINLETETAALGSAWTFSLIMEHGPQTAAQATEPTTDKDRIIQGLEKTLRSLAINTAWPPAFFSAREMVVLADQQVVSVPELCSPRRTDDLVHGQLCGWRPAVQDGGAALVVRLDG